MESIEQHIEKDKELLQDPTLSPQMRRHTADELQHLEKPTMHTLKIITILQRLRCIVMKIQTQMNVKSTKVRNKRVAHPLFML